MCGLDPEPSRLGVPAPHLLFDIGPKVLPCCLAGPILEALQRRFRIVAAEGVRLQSGQAEAFHDVYRGIVQNFREMAQELSSGGYS